MASIDSLKSRLWQHLEDHLCAGSSVLLFGAPIDTMTPADQKRAVQALREVVFAVSRKVEHPTTADDRWYRRRSKAAKP